MDRYHAISDVSSSKDRDVKCTDEEDNIHENSYDPHGANGLFKSQERALNGEHFGTSRLLIGIYYRC